MKKHYLTIGIFLLALSMQAQEKFDLSLSFIGTNATTGNYEVALMGTPNFDETNGNSSDIGAVLSMSDNVYIQSSGFVNDCTTGPPPTSTVTCDYPIPATQWGATYSTEATANAPGRFVYQIARTESGSSTFFDAVNGDPIVLAVFQVYSLAGGAPPTTGDVVLVPNGDPILEGSTNSSFLNINYPVATGGATGDLVGVLDVTPVSFTTLSTQKPELTGVSLYPNPTNGNVFIKGVNDLQRVEVMNVNGQRVMSLNSNLETINVSSLNSGVYFVKLETAVATKTIKLIKK